MMEPLALGGNVLVQVPDVVTSVVTVVAVLGLMNDWLAARGPVLLCGGLPVEEEIRLMFTLLICLTISPYTP